MFALCSRMTQAGPNPLDDQVPFKFSDRTKNCEDHLPGRCARVDLFGDGNKLNAEGAECF